VQVAGSRYYNPGLGRWTSRDPVEERGGWNLYGHVSNTAPNEIDAHGLLSWDWSVGPGGVTLVGSLFNYDVKQFAFLGVTLIYVDFSIGGSALLTPDYSIAPADCHTPPYTLTGSTSYSVTGGVYGVGIQATTSVNNGPVSGSLTVSLTTWLITTSLAQDLQVAVNPFRKLVGSCCYTGSASVSATSTMTYNNAGLAAAAVGVIVAGQYAMAAAPVLLPELQHALGAL
jgi:hypothetical protein